MDFKYSFLAAKNNQVNDWLIQMPANRLSNEFTYRFKDGKKITDTYISAELMHVLQQKHPSDANGKQDYKEAPNAYNLINLNASTTMHINKFPLTLSIGIRNLLNTAYRDYLNSMRYFTDEMGRNISIRMKIQF
ncbi:MAG: TonB-dependent receptor [Bacteroidetes bacterium]|nr:TonB-dependent receptor [Bacteroidota bacterium]